MKKQTHTYNVGDVVTFKFLTGDILTGKITDHTYKDDGTPSYKIRVEENKVCTKIRVEELGCANRGSFSRK